METANRGKRHIAELVDELLAAEKELAGDSIWQQGNREAEQGRLVWPVLVSGQSAERFLGATVYPNDRDLRFTITLNCRDQNIWRFDFEPADRAEVHPFLRGTC